MGRRLHSGDASRRERPTGFGNKRDTRERRLEMICLRSRAGICLPNPGDAWLPMFRQQQRRRAIAGDLSVGVCYNKIAVRTRHLEEEPSRAGARTALLSSVHEGQGLEKHDEES